MSAGSSLSNSAGHTTGSVEDLRKKPGSEKLLSVLPALSVVALVMLAIFNIGYFAKIGLHFLGVMDVSNLVYSFSFLIVILTGTLSVSFWGGYLEQLLELAGDMNARRKLTWGIGTFGVLALTACLILNFGFPQYLPEHSLVDRLAAMFFWVLAIILLAVELADYKRFPKVSVSSGFYLFVIWMLALYYLGRAVAEHEIYTVKETYSFAVKDAPPVVGKILRSSSAGFIIFADKRITFIPQGEIKQVKAVAELSN